MEYIEYDKEEYRHSDFSAKTLELILFILGPEVRDKLLVPSVPVVLPVVDSRNSV